MLLDKWRRMYAVEAVWCSVGHLTTYGPIDSPTFVTPFSFGRLERRTRMKPRTRINHIAIAVTPRVIPTELKIFIRIVVL